MRISDWSSDVCSSDLIPANADGRVDLQALKARLGPDVAAVMITNPNTCGLFERDMKYIADAVHKAGAFVSCAGANFNYIVGRVRPGDLCKIGRASGRDRVCQYLSISVVAVSIKKTNR